MRVVAALALLSLSCSSSSSPSDPGLTYWRDVAPVINDKCVKCHQEGGIAPFPLDNFETVRTMANTIASVTRGYMPPFYVTHDGSCGSFHDEEALTPPQLATLQAWPKSGLIEGTRATLVKAPRAGLTSGDDVTTPQYAPRYRAGMPSDDDYRCFGVSAGPTGFITAYDVLPGDYGLAVEVVAYLVDPARLTVSGKTNAQVVAALDAADAGAGWSCQGSAGDGVEIERIAAVHGPGQGVVSFPPGMGVPQPPGQQLIIGVHYLTNPGVAGKSETTTVRFVHGTASRALRFVARDGFLDTLAGTPAKLPPGQDSAAFAWSKSAAASGALVGFMAHQGARGLGMRVSVGAACAANVGDYYWGWQRVYLYREPYRQLQPSDVLEAECRFTTNQDTAPVAPGYTGSDEMCTTVLVLAD